MGRTTDAVRLLLLGSVLLGAFLRLHHYAEPSLWLDEYGTSWVAAAEGYGDAARRAIERHGQSPFYYLLVKLACDTSGHGPAGLRLVSVTFGIGSVVLAWPLGLAVFRQRPAALLTVAAFALSEPLIRAAQDARPYSLAVFCATASFLAFLRLLERDTPAARAAWVLATAAAFYAHYLFGFIAAIQLAYLVLRRLWAQRRWWTSYLALALLAAPSAAQVASLFGRRAALDWIGPQPWQFPFKVFVDFLEPQVFTVVACFVVLAGTAGEAHRPRPPAGLLALWLLLPLVAFGAIPPLLGTHVLFPRYVLFALPAALLISAWLVALAPGGWRRATAATLLVAASFAFVLLPAYARTRTFSSKNEGGWAQAAALFDAEAGRDDLALYASGFVEADLAAVGGADAELESFLTWPLLANVPPARAAQVRNLPLHVDDATLPYVLSLVRSAAGRPRVWLLGDRFVVAEVGKAFLLETSGFVLEQRKDFGKAVVMEFRATHPAQQQDAEPSRPTDGFGSRDTSAW